MSFANEGFQVRMRQYEREDRERDEARQRANASAMERLRLFMYELRQLCRKFDATIDGSRSGSMFISLTHEGGYAEVESGEALTGEQPEFTTGPTIDSTATRA